MAASVSPDNFYRAFEDRHRGSRELIRQRLLAYLPFVKPLVALGPALPVLDIGCGRGEWLELLSDHGIAAYGVDTDDGMLAACLERGLRVVSVDALAHLGSLPSVSLLAVTGFHIAEHLPFNRLQAVFAQACRVLVPGGLLILETPNPENLLVGASNFYLDPSHQRPLPSQLLAFLAEHQGFSPVRLLRLQEEQRLAKDGSVSLYDVLANVSPDYAIVAQLPFASDPSNAERQSLVLQLTQAFEIECGVSLPALASRYDQQLQLQADAQSQAAYAAQCRAEDAVNQTMQVNMDLMQLHADAQQVKASLKQINTASQHLSADIEQVKVTLQQVNTNFSLLNAHVQRLDANVEKISAQAQQLNFKLTAVHASHSWRITKPLRWLARFFRGDSDKD